MTYQFNAVRIGVQGEWEECIVTVVDGIWKSETMIELIDAQIAQFPDVAAGWKYRYDDSWDGEPGLFFMVIYPKGRDITGDFQRLNELQNRISCIARRFEPDRFPYMDIEEAKA